MDLIIGHLKLAFVSKKVVVKETMEYVLAVEWRRMLILSETSLNKPGG